jgi:ribosomal protein S18 acetylase RimI-like enzyme
VRAEAQGSGIGRALLEACIAHARAADGLTMLTLTVTVGNDGALHLYEHAGFVACGELPRAICVDGHYHAKLTMRLMLD